MLELTAGQVVSYFDTSLGFRHGPKAVLNDRTLAVVFLSNDAYTRRYDEDIVTELGQALGQQHVLVVAAAGSDSVPVGLRITGLDDAGDARPRAAVRRRGAAARPAVLARPRAHPGQPFPRRRGQPRRTWRHGAPAADVS